MHNKVYTPGTAGDDDRGAGTGRDGSALLGATFCCVLDVVINFADGSGFWFSLFTDDDPRINNLLSRFSLSSA